MPMIGAYAFVIIASGMLKRSPKHRPAAHPGHGRRAAPIANPIPKRAMNAAVMAAFLSGKLIGSMNPTSTTPKTRPQITPSRILDITPPVACHRISARSSKPSNHPGVQMLVYRQIQKMGWNWRNCGDCPGWDLIERGLPCGRNAGRKTHRDRILGDKRDQDIGFGRNRLAVFEKRTIAPLPNRSHCGCCQQPLT